MASVGLRTLKNYVDGYTEVKNKLALIESASFSSQRGLQSLFDISLKTNQSLEATSSIYQRFAQNAQALGINQARVASLTETVSKAVAISGASAASAQAALMRFGVIALRNEKGISPRCLNTTYRVNMLTAYSAARYQRMRDNVDNRPYWQYSAVGDERTRPAHLALNGKIYRYDDPFWATFYPPNGFNCRCSVIALAERDLQRRGMDKPDDSSEFLVEVERPADKAGNREKTIGFKLPDGTVRVTDKGFDYNVGRLNYKPNLDLYPEKLAHQFAKVEMRGSEFAHDFNLLAKQVTEIKQSSSHEGKKLTAEQMLQVRDGLTKNFKFAAGVLSVQSKNLLQSKTGTVWLSDDTLIKQFNSRDGQEFGIDDYASLPDIINSPDKIVEDKLGYQFYKDVNGKKLLAVLKALSKESEIFVQSFRLVSDKQWRKAFKE
ncbi:phage minor head protein [uncultured Haemophilus sp.]|nr:phage minor head protein [uncultured Haemophilus sp.]DAN14901.1 MAG TPA: minor capsid component [Caudoviricetes sp.]